MCELAILGGAPVRSEPLDYGGQWIGEDDVEAVAGVLRDSLITCGPKVLETEKAIADYTDSEYAAIVSSGTAALHCACLTAGLKPGDEVITTPLTFAASANCVLYCGAKPVFADINPETYNIDPKSIEEKITNKTKAIIAVDFTGQAVEADEISNICKKHGLVFIEDAAHAIGTRYKGRKVGSLADLTCFSFHPVKTITAGEGGAVTTDSKELYEKLLLFRSHGITKNPEQMVDAPHEGIWCYEELFLGFNYRMTDFQAALLKSQLGKIEYFKKRRSEISKMYDEAFSEMPEIILQKSITESDTCRHLYIIQLNFDRLKCSRREFFDAMCAENVIPQVHYMPVYWFPYYRELGYKRGICPNAERIYSGIMSIPLFPRMNDQDVTNVIETVKKVVDHYRK